MCAVADGLQCYTLLTRYKPGSESIADPGVAQLLFAMAAVQAGSLVIYLVAMIPGSITESDDDESQYERLTSTNHIARPVLDLFA